MQRKSAPSIIPKKEGEKIMTLDELKNKIESADKGNVISCYVANDTLYATFKTREDCIVEVLTPYEKGLLKRGKFTEEDFSGKLFELKTIANY